MQRLCLQITNTIASVTRWAVFEQGGPRIAERVRAQVHAYLEWLDARGAFTSGEFDVQCDSHLHAEPLDPRRGVTILLSFQPVGADDLLWLTLHQTAQGCRVSSTAFAPVTEECA